jgi:Cof subfamily protein (haloacid dehalogenase superfamily)
MTTPRLAAFDLDGTLLNDQSEVSAYTRSVLGTLSSAEPNGDPSGCHFVVATGRGYQSACDRLQALEPIRWIICDNGAAMYDIANDQLVTFDALAPEAVSAYLAEVSQRVPGVALSWGSLSGGFAWTPEFATAFKAEPNQRRLIEADEPLPTDCLKVLLAHRDMSGDDLLDLIVDLPTHGLSVTTSGLAFVEITAPGINKSVRLAELCDQLGVAQQATIAFGDAMNDHAMLQWVGTGYAMANAHAGVKEIADTVTERTNDDDGVAHALRSIFGSIS